MYEDHIELEGVGRGDRSLIHLLVAHLVTLITGELIHVFHPSNHFACNVIFSHVDPDVLFAVAFDRTVRLSLNDGAVTEFSGHKASHFCRPHALVLNNDGTVLFVGYYGAQCVVAYHVATLQLLWRALLNNDISSISYRDGQLFIAPRNAPFTILNAEDGSVVRKLSRVDSTAWSHSVFAGLTCDMSTTLFYECWQYSVKMSIDCLFAFVLIFSPSVNVFSPLAGRPSSSLKFSD